ncbi:hypothetical protein BRADI_2g59775v3 [Brachypodium distachyon]|uniref:Knottin scorpion toxin-like domain-containing protein n=1 Tax=Brachypodium distachyon TaxID=15368 RepID=A0A0Q3JFZ2_BRADI|nr:hypothetical protein BRADI_2g59775v3 [Brachypodium distachyon]
MAFNGAHAFFTLGFLLLMASGEQSSAAAALGTCEFPSTTFRGRCQDGLCAAACHGEHFKGDASKPVIGGRCSDDYYRWLSGGDGGYHVGPRCICIVDCGGKDGKAPPPPPAEQYDPESGRHHHHHSPPPPPAQEPPAEKDEVESRYGEKWWHHHHHSPPPPPAQEPPAAKEEAESRYGEMWWHHHHKSPPPPPAEEPPAPEAPAIAVTN